MITLLPRTHGRQTTDHSSTIPVPAIERPWLSRLLAGEFELPAIAPAMLRLDEAAPIERVVLARALACRDLFILDAADRTVRERLIANLVRLAAERGERVLVLSPDAAAADRLIGAFAEERELRIVRALADDENPQRPPAVLRFTSRAQGVGRAEQLRREAALAIAALEAKLSRLERTRSLRTRLEAIDRDRQALQAERDALAGDPRQLESGTHPEAAALRERLAALHAHRDALLAPFAAEQAVLAAKRIEKAAELKAALEQQAAARKKPGFLSRLFGAAQTADSPESVQVIAALEAETRGLADRETAVAAAAEAANRDFTEELAKELGTAAAARQAALEAAAGELDAEAARLDLAIRELHPRATPDDTVENAALNLANRADLERELAVARTRLDELSHAGSDLARRLLAETQIAIGTPGSLGSDPVFKAIGPQPAFGLLILDHAEELMAADFEPLAALANRCVLAGDAAFPDDRRPPVEANGHSRRPAEPTLLARLARRLDGEPWAIESDRLVFRLVHLPPDKRKSLSREPVLDHPHVELRVAAGDGGDPILAEIAFPVNTSVIQAKSFLVSQLGEVLLRPCGERIWRHAEDSLTACWPMLETGAGDWVDLEPGIRELVAGAGPAAFTVAIAFDRGSGWTEEQAEGWLNEHVAAASASRLAVLPRHAAPALPRCQPVG